MRFVYALLAVFSITLFAFSVVLILPAYVIIFLLFPKSKAPHAAHGLSRFWAYYVLMITFIRPVIKNKNLIDPKKTYIFISNHQSQLYIPLYFISCRNTFRILEKKELTKIPLLGYIIKNLYLTVDRADKNDRHKSIQTMSHSLLQEKISVFLCPEGTRNRTSGILLPFKDGAFRLSAETGVPIAALITYNSGSRNNPKQPLSLIPGTIEGEWLGVFDPPGKSSESVEKLKSDIYQLMENKIRTFRNEKER